VKNIFFYISVFFVFSSIQGQELLPFVENFTKSNYNGDNQVWSIVQGSDNAMYFANNHYFLRYNGVKWESYTLPNKTILRSVFADGDLIYTGSYNEFGYWKRVSGKMQYTSLSKNKNLFTGKSINEEIWKIFKFQNKIYFQSFNQLFIYDGKSFEKVSFPTLISYCFPVQDKLYVASVSDGVYLYSNKKFVPIEKWSALKNSIIHSIDINKGKTFVFTKKNGVFFEENGVLKPWNFSLNNELKTQLINSARFIDNDRLVIGTAFKGLYVVNLKENSLVNINRNNGLKNNTVLSLGFDLENDLWLGMDNGIVHIEINSPYSIFSDNTGILGTVYSVSPRGKDYIIGSNHGVFIYENKKLNFINGTEGQVWQIDKIKDKYIIGHNDATYEFQNNQLIKLNNVNGGWKTLKNVFDGGYFQGTYSGIMKYPDDSFSSFKRIEGLTKPIKNIAQNDKKTLWAVDSYKGLYRIDFDENNNNTKKITNVTQQNGLKDDYNVKLFQFRNEIIFYVDNTWYKNNPITNKLEVYPIFNDNFKNITDITSIDDNNFLIVKEGLFYIINIKESNFIWNLIPKKYYEGKNLSDDTKVVKQGNGLIFNLDDGFFVYNVPNKKSANRKIEIEGFYENELIDDNTKINYNQSIEIDVISPYFGYKKESLYYKLNDAKELKSIENGKITLNNLESGNQNIQVLTREGNGFKKVAEYDFYVSKPWYFSFWMVLLYLLIIGGGLFLYYRWNKLRYTQKIQLNEEELRHRQQIYQMEIEAENKQKIQEYEKHILEIQVQTKASEVAGKSLSIAKQSEMIESIQKLLEKEQDLVSLKNNIKKTIKLNSINNKEWETFENNLYKSHEDFIKRLTSKYPKLSSKDIKLCIYLKMSLSSKEIAPLMNISFRGVELHRYRLRKKLDLQQDVNLSSFMNTI